MGFILFHCSSKPNNVINHHAPATPASTTVEAIHISSFVSTSTWISKSYVLFGGQFSSNPSATYISGPTSHHTQMSFDRWTMCPRMPGGSWTIVD